MSNLNNNGNSSQYPLTDTNMFVNLLANSDKLVSEGRRYEYNNNDHSEKNPELDDDHSKYVSERHNSEQHNTENDNYNYNHNTDTKNTDIRYSESYNNAQKSDTCNTKQITGNTNIKNEDENLTAEELMLRKLDMLRKLSELAQAGVKLSQNYNMNSDYKMMKYEYELHKGIRAKQNGINWMSSSSLNLIYGIEMLNEKYNPFDIKLKGWSEQMNADVNNYYDVFGELYEKYNQPGKNMAPELKILLMVSGSALKFHLTNTMMGSLPTLNTQLDEDPLLAEQLRQKAIAQKMKEQAAKNNEALKQNMTKEHQEAAQKAHDLNLIKQKELELQNLKRDNAQKNAELQSYKEKLLISQTQQNTNINKSQPINNAQPINRVMQQQQQMQQNLMQQQQQQMQQQQMQQQQMQQQQSPQNNMYQQQIKIPPAVQRMMQMQQNKQANYEDQMKQQFGLNNNSVIDNKLETLQAQTKYMEELEKLKALKIQKEKELEKELEKEKKNNFFDSDTSHSSQPSIHSDESNKTSKSNKSSKSSKSSVEYNINLKTILSDSKNKMLDMSSSEKIKDLGTVSQDEISRSNISLGKKKVKKDKSSKASKESGEKKDSSKVVKQKKTGISLF